MAHVADDVLHHDDRAIHNHAEIQRAKGQQVCWNAFQLETRRGKQQRKRDRQGDDERSTNIPQEQKQNDNHQNDAFREIVEHGMRGVVDQITTVDERNYLYPGRQDVVVQLFDLGMDSGQCIVCVCAFT